MYFSIGRRTQHRAHPAGAIRPDVNGCPRYDIYFIGVSLPSSMIIYNCCPRALDCNYYNYRFFVRALSESDPGPGPDVPFVPSLSMQLHPFGPSFLGASVRFSLSFFPSVSRSRFFLLYLARSLLFLSREQRPDLRRLRCRNGFWKLDSRANRVLALDS